MNKITNTISRFLQRFKHHQAGPPERPICIACHQPYATAENAYQDEEGHLNWSDFVCRRCYNQGKRQLSPDVVFDTVKDSAIKGSNQVAPEPERLRAAERSELTTRAEEESAI